MYIIDLIGCVGGGCRDSWKRTGGGHRDAIGGQGRPVCDKRNTTDCRIQNWAPNDSVTTPVWGHSGTDVTHLVPVFRRPSTSLPGRT